MKLADSSPGGGVSLILRRARVLTMDPRRPSAEAVAVREDRIVAVGESAALVSLATDATVQLDCHGLIVAPGFIDAHAHILAQAASERHIDCSRARSVAEIVEILRQGAATVPNGNWLRAGGYHEESLLERRHPTRADLDRAASGRPIRLTHHSGHASVLNTAGLAVMGITARTEEPDGATIERSPETGEPSGVLLEMEDELNRITPPVDPATAEARLGDLSERFLAAGVTSVQDLGHRNNRERALFMAGFVASGSFRPRLTMATGYAAFERGDDACAEGIGRGPVKIMLNETGSDPAPPKTELIRQVAAIHRAGRQAAIHAIGRAAIGLALDAIEHTQTREGPFLSHRIEHASLTSEQISLRMATLGVTAVSNPAFIWQSGDRYLRSIPHEDLPDLYDIAGMRRAGVLVAGGSDCPVAPPEPLIGIEAACSRRTSGGQRVPGLLLSRDAATELFTRCAARAGLEDHEKGSVREGLLADLVLLEETPAGSRVRMTILGGAIVWASETTREWSGLAAAAGND
jgi:predicted amidohydrolase YtcJ